MYTKQSITALIGPLNQKSTIKPLIARFLVDGRIKTRSYTSVNKKRKFQVHFSILT